MGPYTLPTSVAGSKQTRSNSATIDPGPNDPSLPPFLLEGHVEDDLATSSKLAPSAIFSLSSLHVASSLTRIWEAVIVDFPPAREWLERRATAQTYKAKNLREFE